MITVRRKRVRLHVASYECYGFEAWVDQDFLRAYIAVGNAKLRDVIIWSLPAVDTCPGSTVGCRRWCYAKKGYAHAATPARERNLEFTKRPFFREAMIGILSSPQLEDYKLVRVHESGDFYSDKYVNDWMAIAEACPTKRFVAYTRSHDLFHNGVKIVRGGIMEVIPGPEIPDNFIVRYSVDSTTTDYPEMDLPRAFTFPKEEPAKGLDCPVDKLGKDKASCNGPCTYCWDQRRDVTFRIKTGRSKQRTDILKPYTYRPKKKRSGDEPVEVDQGSVIEGVYCNSWCMSLTHLFTEKHRCRQWKNHAGPCERGCGQ